MKADATVVESLQAFKFLDNDQIISDLKSELATYLAAAEDVDIETSPLKWWEVNSVMHSNWATACKKVLLCQPSSASVERIFSILSCFSVQQQSALELSLHSCYSTIGNKDISLL